MADGNKLLSECQAAVRFMDNNNDVNNDEYGQGKCLGTVEGVIGMTMLLNGDLPKKLQMCYPKGGISNGQGIRILVKFLQENPKILNLDATVLTKVALADAYPCKG
jgi:hypothetical protein